MLADMLAPGTLLCGGAFRVDYAVGQGGFGITYRATDTRLSRSVAIKEFFPRGAAHRETKTGRVIVRTSERAGTRRALDRFTREGRLLAQVTHPNVVRVHQLFEEHDTAYLVMEYLAGRTLREELNAAQTALGVGRLSEGRVREVAGDIVSALSAVHAAGVLHLDIKPENTMLVRDPLRGPGGERAVLIDFGAGRQDTGENAPTSTVFLTVPYAPPELMLRQELGPESDIFQVGMLLHELLTGKLPPSAMVRLAGDRFNTDKLPDPWAGILAHALYLERDARPKDIAAWWAVSHTAPSTDAAPVVAPKMPLPTTPPPARSTPAPPTVSSPQEVSFIEEAARQAAERRRKFLIWGAGGIAALTGVGLIGALWNARPASDPARIPIRIRLQGGTVDEALRQLWIGYRIPVVWKGEKPQGTFNFDVPQEQPASVVLQRFADHVGATMTYDPKKRSFTLAMTPLTATYCGLAPARQLCPVTRMERVTPEQRADFEKKEPCSQHARWCINQKCSFYHRNPVPSGDIHCKGCGLPLSDIPRIPVANPVDAPRTPGIMPR
jgi:serine/threonine protein kinase